MTADIPPMPTDKNTLALVLLVLVFVARELWAFAKNRAEREEKAKDDAIAKLEVKIDALGSDMRSGLERLFTSHADLAADVAVNRTRIERLEHDFQAALNKARGTGS